MNKIRKSFYNNTIQSVLISFIITIIVIIIIFILLWSRRKEIISYLIKEHKTEDIIIIPFQKSVKPIEEKVNEKVVVNISKKTQKIKKTPTIVSAVKIAKPAVVSIVVSKQVPKYDTIYKKVNVLDQNGKIIPNVYINKPIYTQNGVEKKKLGSGSGFIISSSGLIVTNRHVVSGKNIILDVLLNNGKKYSAQIIDKDPVLDLALIKITGSKFPYLKLSDSSKLEVGQTVIAIGNALGEFKNSVSVGVISGLSRSIYAGDNFGKTEFLNKVIQTDAAINKGNSGGPLLNINGDVIGINVAIVEGSSSVGFSLPINSVKSAINSVKKSGRIIRPYLGIRYTMITPELQKKNNLLYDHGILIEKGLNNKPGVIPNSPADKAGLKEGYIILNIDGVDVTKNSNLSNFIRAKKIGDFITMKVYTGKLIKTFVAVLKQAPSNI